MEAKLVLQFFFPSDYILRKNMSKTIRKWSKSLYCKLQHHLPKPIIDINKR